MSPADQQRFPPLPTTLADGRRVVVRFLGPEDGPSLGDMYEGLPPKALRHYGPHPLDREHGLRNAAKWDHPYEVVVVLETTEGEIGGYAWYRWRDAEAEASGFGICVREDYWHCGAGRALMNRVLEVADAGVGPRLMKLTCQHANEGAVALYLKLGFEVVQEGLCGDRRGFPAEPQYWMERRCG